MEITFNDQSTQKKKIQVQVESFVRTLLKKALSLQKDGQDSADNGHAHFVSQLACLDFYAMMQQVSYLKRFMIWVTFKPHNTIASNIRMLFATHAFK